MSLLRLVDAPPRAKIVDRPYFYALLYPFAGSIVSFSQTPVSLFSRREACFAARYGDAWPSLTTAVCSRAPFEDQPWRPFSRNLFQEELDSRLVVGGDHARHPHPHFERLLDVVECWHVMICCVVRQVEVDRCLNVGGGGVPRGPRSASLCC